MAFCGKCGAPLDGGKFCPNCGAANEAENDQSTSVNRPKKSHKSGSKKKIAVGVIGVIVVAIAVLAITQFTATVDEPCDWCGDSPSIAYELSDGSYSYVCKECSQNCALCGEKATKHYENMLGMIVFVCGDCYEELQ